MNIHERNVTEFLDRNRNVVNPAISSAVAAHQRKLFVGIKRATQSIEQEVKRSIGKEKAIELLIEGAVKDHLNTYFVTEMEAFKARLVVKLEASGLNPKKNTMDYFNLLKEAYRDEVSTRLTKEEVAKAMLSFPEARLRESIEKLISDPAVTLEGRFLATGMSLSRFLKVLIKRDPYIMAIDNIEPGRSFMQNILEKTRISLYTVPLTAVMPIPSPSVITETINNAFLAQLLEEVEKSLKVSKSSLLASVGNKIDSKIHNEFLALSLLSAELQTTNGMKYEYRVKSLVQYLNSPDGKPVVSALQARSSTWIGKVLAIFGFKSATAKHVLPILDRCKDVAARLAPGPAVRSTSVPAA